MYIGGCQFDDNGPQNYSRLRQQLQRFSSFYKARSCAVYEGRFKVILLLQVSSHNFEPIYLICRILPDQQQISKPLTRNKHRSLLYLIDPIIFQSIFNFANLKSQLVEIIIRTSFTLFYHLTLQICKIVTALEYYAITE